MALGFHSHFARRMGNSLERWVGKAWSAVFGAQESILVGAGKFRMSERGTVFTLPMKFQRKTRVLLGNGPEAICVIVWQRIWLHLPIS